MKEKGLEIKSMHIKYVFTVDEKRENALKMATKISEKEAKEEDKKAVMSKFTYEVNSLSAEINILAKELNQGYTHKNHDCYEIFDYDTKEVFTHRADTDEQVEARTMSSAEYQREMFDPREEVPILNDEVMSDLLKDEGENKPTEFLNDKLVE